MEYNFLARSFIPDANFEVFGQLEREISQLGYIFHGLYCKSQTQNISNTEELLIIQSLIKRCV